MGLHQGSAQGPFFFAQVMDRLTTDEVREESPWTMMFADEIVICSESREQAEVCAGEKKNECQYKQVKIYACEREGDIWKGIHGRSGELDKFQLQFLLGRNYCTHRHTNTHIYRLIMFGSVIQF